MRPSWVEVDLAAIRHNIATLVDLVAPAAVCAVVKADGYGHGDVPVAEAALEAGATWLAVALLEEGVRLREAGLEAPILLLSEPDRADTSEVVHWGLTPTLYRLEMVEALAAAAQSPLGVHVKVDTGMHRVGVSPAALPDLLAAVADQPGLTLEGVWTHFAVSEEDEDFTRQQIARFDLLTQGVKAPMVHLANTAGAILHPGSRRNLVRIGIGTYGVHPGVATKDRVDLQPAMKIVSHVAYLQRLEAGARPSYGRRRPLSTTTGIATVPIGYADGMPRLLSEGGEVLIGGKRRPLAGTVTMDQIMVEVGDDEVRVGDEVVLIGRQGDESITVDDWAEKLNTIGYEIVCQVGPRLPRRYRS